MDGSTNPEGEFRRPTEAEWSAIKDGRCPWNDDEWKVSSSDV